MKKIINWGIIGAGNAAINLAKNFKDSHNSKLIGLASKNEDKRLFNPDLGGGAIWYTGC